MMTTRGAVDPELLALLDAWQAFVLSDEVLPRLRARDLPLPPAGNDSVIHEEHVVPGPTGAPDVRLQLYRPAGDRMRGCIYHIHGGGYVGGKARDLEAVHCSLAEALDCVIVSVDYRLAPETPHPGPVEDCYAGLVWTHESAAALGIDPARIGVMGESAGGGLAAALALLTRDRAGPALTFQCLTYPMLDDRTCTVADPHPMTGEFIWTPHNNRYGWRALLGEEPGTANLSPYAAAARANSLDRLPPTFLMTGSLDLFLEEGVEFARRLIRAGVACELHVYSGAFHGFDLAPDAQVAVRARGAREDFLKRMLEQR